MKKTYVVVPIEIETDIYSDLEFFANSSRFEENTPEDLIVRFIKEGINGKRNL